VVERDDADRVMAHRYVRDPEHAPIIERAFQLSDEGLGDAPIARELTKAGHPTKSGKRFNRRRVQDLLRTRPTRAGWSDSAASRMRRLRPRRM
jgi:Recombinase